MAINDEKFYIPGYGKPSPVSAPANATFTQGNDALATMTPMQVALSSKGVAPKATGMDQGEWRQGSAKDHRVSGREQEWNLKVNEVLGELIYKGMAPASVLADYLDLPEDSKARFAMELLGPGEFAAMGAVAGKPVQLLSKLGRIELPYRTAERTPAGVHMLEKNALRGEFGKHYAPTPQDARKVAAMDGQKALEYLNSKNEGMQSYKSVLDKWLEKFRPIFVDGEYKGMDATGALPDLDPNALKYSDEQLAQMYRDQLDIGIAAQELIQDIPTFARANQSLVMSKLGADDKGIRLYDALRGLESNPPGPNTLQSILQNQYMGPEMLRVGNGASPRPLSPRIYGYAGSHLDNLKAAAEADASVAASRGWTPPWRSNTTTVETPEATETFTKGVIKPPSGSTRSTYFMDSPTPNSDALLVTNRDGIVTGLEPGEARHYSDIPQAYLPANAPITGHMMEQSTHDMILPTTYREFDPESGRQYNKMDPIPWLLDLKRSLKAEDFSRLISEQQAAVTKGVMKDLTPTLGQLALTDPYMRRKIRRDAGALLSVSADVDAKAPKNASAIDLLFPMDKRYGSYNVPEIKTAVDLSKGDKYMRSHNIHE